MQQVAVGGVELHAVESGVDGTAGGGGEVGTDPGEALGVEGDRGLVGETVTFGVVRPATVVHGARGDDRQAGDLLVGVPAGVHELGDDASSFGMDGIGDGGPAGDLVIGVQAGLGVHGAAVEGRGGAVGDDEAHTGALPEVLDHEIAGASLQVGAEAAHGGLDDAVRQLEPADGQRGIERRFIHAGHLTHTGSEAGESRGKPWCNTAETGAVTDL